MQKVRVTHLICNICKEELFLNLYLINMIDETLGWKILSYDENGEPLLKYDEHHDEIINVQTGEVIKGH